ncbi:MAG TPA: hypothetical protein PKD61_09425 [Polyangiaceae bacterium]|nr:hypothetical protein [Polyangiaceae bacterium]
MSGTFTIFSQEPSARVPLAALLRSAGTHFRSSINVVFERGVDERGDATTTTLRLFVENERLGIAEHFDIATRARRPEDLARAEEAERRGRAAGMATLAARCPTVWELSASGGEVGTFLLCAMLASVALGPVMPPDGATLYGVRGAMERADRAAGAGALER